MTHSVVFHPIARADLIDLYDYIAERASPDIARTYLDRIEAFCSDLRTLPERGVDRRDLGQGIRTQALERRVLIVYQVVAERV